MNEDYNRKNLHEEKDNNELSRGLLNKLSIDTKDYENDDNGEVPENGIEAEEENVIPELNDVAILSSSKLSLKNGVKKNNDFEKSNFRKKIHKFFDNLPLKGYILALISVLFNSIGAIFVKLSTLFSATDITLTRYVLQFLIMMTIVKCKGFNPLGPKNQRKLLSLRAIIGTCGLLTFFFSFKLLEPSDCFAIVHSSVIITSVLARIFLKERLSIAHIVALILTGSGVFLIAKPKSLFLINSKLLDKTSHVNTTINYTNESLADLFANYSNRAGALTDLKQSSYSSTFYTTMGVLLALLCAFSSSSVQVMLKALSSKKVHYSIVTVYVTYIGIPVSFILSLIFIVTKTTHQELNKNLDYLSKQFLFAVIGALLGVGSQIFLNLSMLYEEASKVAILRSLDVFLTFVFQYFLLNISVDIFSIIGSSSILIGSFIVLSFKLIENKLKINKKDEKLGIAEVEAKSCKKPFCIRLIEFKF